MQATSRLMDGTIYLLGPNEVRTSRWTSKIIFIAVNFAYDRSAIKYIATNVDHSIMKDFWILMISINYVILDFF